MAKKILVHRKKFPMKCWCPECKTTFTVEEEDLRIHCYDHVVRIFGGSYHSRYLTDCPSCNYVISVGEVE